MTFKSWVRVIDAGATKQPDVSVLVGNDFWLSGYADIASAILHAMAKYDPNAGLSRAISYSASDFGDTLIFNARGLQEVSSIDVIAQTARVSVHTEGLEDLRAEPLRAYLFNTLGADGLFPVNSERAKMFRKSWWSDTGWELPVSFESRSGDDEHRLIREYMRAAAITNATVFGSELPPDPNGRRYTLVFGLYEPVRKAVIELENRGISVPRCVEMRAPSMEKLTRV